MSKELLLNLNGNKKGEFYKWLDDFKGEPRIAWYPSAGEDFRDLLYLHPDYAELNKASGPEPQAPNLFLHTDYFPWGTSTFLDTRTIHLDDRTSVTLTSIEELPSCDLPLDDQIVDFPKGSAATGRVLFMQLEVHSDKLGSFTCPVLYAFVENGAFCSKVALPANAVFSHVMHIRYGGGLGGGKASGMWLENVLKGLGCECYVTDGRRNIQSGDERTWTLYPELAPIENKPELKTIRSLPGRSWSEYSAEVQWQILA